MHDLKLIMRKQSDQTEGHSTKYLLKNVKRLRTVNRQKESGFCGCDPVLPPERYTPERTGEGRTAKCESRLYVT